MRICNNLYWLSINLYQESWQVDHVLAQFFVLQLKQFMDPLKSLDLYNFMLINNVLKGQGFYI